MQPYVRTKFTMTVLKGQDNIESNWASTLFALEEETVLAKANGNMIEGQIDGYFSSHEYDCSTSLYAKLSKELGVAIVVDTYNYDDEECFTQYYEDGVLVLEERPDTEKNFDEKAMREWLQEHEFENYDTTCSDCGMYAYEYEVGIEADSDMGHACV